MIEFEDSNKNNSDAKMIEILDVKLKKEENIPIKSEASTRDTSFNDSMDQMTSLIVTEKPITNKNANKKTPNRRGNTFMYFFDKNGSPLIVIGPHCKI